MSEPEPDVDQPVGPQRDGAKADDQRLRESDRSRSDAPDGGDVTGMTPSLWGRLFGVPLLIVSIIVGSAIVVVLSFGSITTERQRPLDELVSVLEASSGEKTAGVLLPGEKELWQTGRELALRLAEKDTELSPAELVGLVDRLSAMLARDAARPGPMTEMGRKKMHFVMRALASTGLPAVVAPLAAMLADGHPATRREALTTLGSLRRMPEARGALPEMTDLLEDSDPVVRTVACVSISSMARPQDADVIEALKRAYYDDHREVKWNAALALARLGNSTGRPLLLDMLERAYWEREVPVRKATRQGIREYPMPPVQVARHLLATVEAASRLDDEEIWARIAELATDSVVHVRDTARKALESRESTAVRSGEE